MARRIVALTLLVTFTASCTLSARWEMYQREKAQWETDCIPPQPNKGCAPLDAVRRFHRRWDELIGRVPASDALWAEHEQTAREVSVEIVSHYDHGTPLRSAQYWQDRRRATEERYALDIAQQLADQEREAEARRQQAIIALAMLGLIASQVAAVAAPAPAPRIYQVPTAAPPSRVDPAVRRDLEAQWAVRTGGATGGAMNQYIRDALKRRTTETCTYSLDTLHGMMVCVDGQGNVRAR